MISEIEKMELERELEYFRDGLRSHIRSIQSYIDIWAKGGQTNKISKIHLSVEHKIEKLVLEAVFLYTNDEERNDEKDTQNPFFNAILRRFYKKLTKK